MIYAVLFVIVFACFLSVTIRVIVMNPHYTVYYMIRDLIQYFRYKKWRVGQTGKIICYVGLFGKGKTLSAVHKVISFYNKYNDKMIYDPNRKKWVTQKVHIVSNVDLSIPFERFVSLSQMLYVAETMRGVDEQNDTLTITLFLGDEFSVQLNSRSFKTNIDPLFLNTLLTCRHHHISLIYTAQRFNHVDALLRQVTSYVITCDKLWRIMRHAQYDAFELENAADPTNVKSQRRFGWFITDAAFAAYDTLACVGNLAKSCKEGDMISAEEILALQCNQPSDMDSVQNPSRKFVRRQKKMFK